MIIVKLPKHIVQGLCDSAVLQKTQKSFLKKVVTHGSLWHSQAVALHACALVIFIKFHM